MGDININSMSDDLRSQDRNDISTSYGSHNLITLSTRITTKSATSIDICITNIEETETTPVIISCDISDHLPVFCLSPTTFSEG